LKIEFMFLYSDANRFRLDHAVPYFFADKSSFITLETRWNYF
jgi:hypothetical protein